MKQRDGPGFGIDQVDGGAVGDGHIEHETGCAGRVSVHPFNEGPAIVPAEMPSHPVPVNLIAQDVAGESGLNLAKGSPPGHHVADGLGRPEAQVEGLTTVPPPGNPSDQPVPLPPEGNLVARNRPGGGGFSAGMDDWNRTNRGEVTSVVESLDIRAERPEAGIDRLVASLDLADVVNGTGALGGQRGDQHRHAGAYVRRLDRATAER